MFIGLFPGLLFPGLLFLGLFPGLFPGLFLFTTPLVRRIFLPVVSRRLLLFGRRYHRLCGGKQ